MIGARKGRLTGWAKALAIALAIVQPAAPAHALQDSDVSEQGARDQLSPTSKADIPDPRVYWPSQPSSRQIGIEQAAPDAKSEPMRALPNAQISTGTDDGDAEQISAGVQRTGTIGQLSAADIESRLDQLTEAEQRVLLEAIVGTDLCERDDVPETVRDLCATRIETRASEFATAPATQLSAEERLLGEGLEETGTPRLAQIIDRLARGSARPDDPDNQAIASIALAGTPAPTGQPDDNADDNAGDLPLGTQALIEAIVQQLTGPGN